MLRNWSVFFLHRQTRSCTIAVDSRPIRADIDVERSYEHVQSCSKLYERAIDQAIT